jgi:integrase
LHLILVAAFGGLRWGRLRWGELAGLRRKRVDLERGTVTVAEQLLEVNGAFSVGPPKSAAGRRTVTLPAVVVEALAEHLRRYTAKSPEPFVFLSSQGKHLRAQQLQPSGRAASHTGRRDRRPARQ